MSIRRILFALLLATPAAQAQQLAYEMTLITRLDYADDINDAGRVVGEWSPTGEDSSHAFAYGAGVLEDLGGRLPAKSPAARAHAGSGASGSTAITPPDAGRAPG